MARKAPPGLSGKVIYCPVCLRKTGTYQGTGRKPVAGKRCADCKTKAKERKARAKGKVPPVSVGSSTSVRTVSGGLPTLGKGHR
jgi:hypothetical protein